MPIPEEFRKYAQPGYSVMNDPEFKPAHEQEQQSGNSYFDTHREELADRLLYNNDEGVDAAMFAPGTDNEKALGDLNKTRAYNLYAYTDEQKLIQAQKMSKDLNIDTGLILYDDETYVNALDAWNTGRGARSLREEGQPFDLGKVYAKYPALADMAQKDAYTAAAAMHNIKAVGKLQDAWDAYKYMEANEELVARESALSRKLMDNKGRNAEIDKEYAAINADREKLAKKLPGYEEAPVTRFLADFFSQLPQQARGIREGLKGAVLGAWAGFGAGKAYDNVPGMGRLLGATTSLAMAQQGMQTGARIGYTRQTYEEIFPQEMLKYAYDGNGRSYDNALFAARASAAAQTAIELYDANLFLKFLGKKKAAREAAQEITKGTFGMSVKQGIKNVGEVTLKTGATETMEEGLQSAASDIVGNITAPAGAKNVLTWSEIMGNAGEAMLEAAPVSFFGFGASGGIMSTVPHIRRGARFLSERTNAEQGYALNVRVGDTVRRMMQDADIREFYNKNKKAAAQMAAEEMKRQTGIENVNIDVAGIMEQENGAEVMDAIAKLEGMDEEQKNAAIASGAQMQIKGTTFMQVAAEQSLFGEESTPLTDFMNVAGKDAPNKYRVQKVMDALKANENFAADATEEQLTRHAGTFYDAFKDTLGVTLGDMDESAAESLVRNIIGEIARTNPQDFAAGVDAVLQSMEGNSQERKALEQLAPALKETAEDFVITGGLSKEGIAVYRGMVATLLDSQTADVRMSAKASAILVARRAEMYAKVMQEMGNKEYTALDYMKRFTVDANAQGGIGDYNEAVYEPGKWYVQNIIGNELGTYSDITELRKKANDFYLKNLQNKTAYNPIIGNIRLGKGLEKNETRFGTKGRRKMISTGAKPSKLLAVRYLKEIIENSNFVTEKDSETPKHGKEHFYYLYSKLSLGENDERYVIVSIREAQNKELLYYNHNVYTEEEYKKIEDTFASHDASPTMSGQDAEVSSFANSLSQKAISGKQKVVYNQTAYHGSPYRFKKFDLGAIGTGEGAQAHGWGLYFAQDRSVAANYRTIRSNKIWYNGKDINELSLELQRKGEYDKATIVDDFILATDEAELDYDDYEPATVKWFKTKILPKIERNSSLFKVDIPENDVLLDENKPLKEQNENIQKIVEEFLKEQFPKSYKYDLDWTINTMDGGDFYARMAKIFSKKMGSGEMSGGNFKAASEWLNAHGIKGITYNGGRDGRCFVVFDDKAIRIIETYNEEVNGKARGAATIFDDGTTLIQLFTRETDTTASADKSTLPHEFGHMFLRDLQELAEMDNAPEHIRKDWETVKQFLKVKDGEQLTRKQHEQFARHFESYLMTGEAPTKELKGVFRNFKKWLTDIYRDIKTLLSIEGGAEQLNPDMKAVFDRMLASETEIEAAAAEQDMQMENLLGLGEFVGSEPAMELVQKWLDDAKAAAKESMLSKLMEDLQFWKGQNAEDVKAAARATAEQTVRNNAYYKARVLADAENISIDDARRLLGLTQEETDKAFTWIRDNGYDPDNMNDTVEREAVHVESLGKGILKTDDEIRAMAEASLNEHLEEVAVLQNLLFNEYVSDFRRLQSIIADGIEREVAEVKGDPKQDKFQKRIEKLKAQNQKKIDELKARLEQAKKERKAQERFDEAEKRTVVDIEVGRQKAKDEQKAQKQVDAAVDKKAREDEKRTLKELQYQERYLAAEKAFLDDIQQAKDAKEVDELVQKYKEKVYQERWRTAEANLRADVQKGINEQHKEIVRQYRDAVRGYAKDIKADAEGMLANHRIGEAMDFKMWQRLAQRELRNSISTMAKAVTMAGRDVTKSQLLMEQAMQARMSYSVYLHAANAAQKLNRKLLKKAQSIKKRTATMKKGKNVSARCRYVENRLLYLFGFTGKQDMNVPVDADVNLIEWEEFKAAFQDINEEGLFGRGFVPFGLAPRVVDVIKNDTPLRWADMSLGEYQDAMDVLDFVYNLGKREKGDHKLRYADSEGKVRTLAEALEIVKNELGPANLDLSLPHGLDDEKQSRIKEFAKGMHAELVKADVVLRALGKLYDYVYTPFKRAADKEADMRESATEQLKKAAESIKDLGSFTSDVVCEIQGDKLYKLTRAKLVCMALNYGTEKNAQRLKAGHGITDEQILKALENLQEGDIEFVNAVWKFYEQYWHESAAMEERISGFAPKKENGTVFKVTLKNGKEVTFNGGYFPIKYNYDAFRGAQRSVGQTQQQASDTLQARRYGMASGSRYSSHTKNRVEEVPPGRELMLDVAVIEQSANDIIHDICFREVTLDAVRILNDGDISTAVQERVGTEVYDRLTRWAKDNYAPQASPHSSLAQAMGVLRRNIVGATLAMKVGWSILNVGNLFLIGRQAGAGKTAKMLFDYVRRSDAEIQAYAEKVNEWSPYMRGLENNLEQNVKDIIEMDKASKLTARKLYDKTALAAAEWGYALPTTIDRMTVKPYWLETYREKYNECLDKGIDAKNAHDIAVDAGDEAVRGIIGSMRDIDLAQVQRTNNEIVKTLTMFYGYFSVVYNTFAKDYYRYRGDKDKLFANMLKTFIATCIGDALLQSSWETLKADDKELEDGALWFWLKKVGIGSVGTLVNTVPGARDVWRMGEYAAQTGRIMNPQIPQFRAATSSVDGVTKLLKGKYIDGAGSLAEGLAYGFGLPANLVAPVANIAHAMDGDYTYMEAVTAALMDRRLKDPRKKKEAAF